MEKIGKQIESREEPERIVRIGFDTYGVFAFLEIPNGMNIENEKEDFFKSLSEDDKDEGPQEVGKLFIESLIKNGARKIKVDEYDWGDRLY